MKLSEGRRKDRIEREKAKTEGKKVEDRKERRNIGKLLS